jgi:hypothetical protein
VKSDRLNWIWFQPSSRRMGMVQMKGFTRVVLCTGGGEREVGEGQQEGRAGSRGGQGQRQGSKDKAGGGGWVVRATYRHVWMCVYRSRGG